MRRRGGTVLLLVLAAGVLALVAVLARGVIGMIAVVVLVLALLAAGAAWDVAVFRGVGRLPPDGPPAQAGRLRVRADGGAEWEPPAQPPRYPTAGDLVRHKWWDPDGAPRHYAHVAVEVPDAVVGPRLHRATRRALRSARRALPRRGRVRASAAVRDKAGPTSLVRARIEVQGIGASPEWAEAAARAFAERLRREVG